MSTTGNKTKIAVSALKKPRITEKATMLAGAKNPVYCFVVAKDSTKTEIIKAVKQQYKVTPVKVNIINLPSKVVVRRGRFGSKPVVKKAMVYLKPGEKIELV